jgi:hypothetical protein
VLRRIIGGVLLVIGVISALGALTLHQAVKARADLLRARTEVTALEDQLRAGDTTNATALLKQIQSDTTSAKHLTGGLQWSIAAHLPGRAGRIVTLTRGLTTTLDAIASQGLPGLVSAAIELRPSTLVANHAVSLRPLINAATPVDKAQRIVLTSLAQVKKLPTSGLGELDQARSELLTQLSKVSGTLTGSAQALQLLPSMLGENGPRTYFLAFQNPAEERGTGGIVGAYGFLVADKGKLTLIKTGTDGQLQAVDGTADTPVDLGSETTEFETQWDSYGSRENWFTTNLTANFPWAAATWRAKYSQLSGLSTPVDGAMALDPESIGQLLGDRSITLSDGEVITGPNYATFLEQTLAVRYGLTKQSERKALELDASHKAFDALLSGGSTSGLLHALQDSAGHGDIQVWSAHPTEQAILAKGVIAGQVPKGPGPYAWVGVENASGNKGGVFLERTLRYDTGACPAKGVPTRVTTITVTLTNNTPADAPPIQTGRFDEANPATDAGTDHVLELIETTQGASVDSATVQTGSTKPVELDVSPGYERDHPLFIADVQLPRGVPVEVVLHMVEPFGGKTGEFRAQPGTRSEVQTRRVTTCS